MLYNIVIVIQVEAKLKKAYLQNFILRDWCLLDTFSIAAGSDKHSIYVFHHMKTNGVDGYSQFSAADYAFVVLLCSGARTRQTFSLVKQRAHSKPYSLKRVQTFGQLRVFAFHITNSWLHVSKRFVGYRGNWHFGIIASCSNKLRPCASIT